MGSFGLTDVAGNTFGYSRVIVYGSNGKIKFPTGGGGGSGTVTSIGLTVPSGFSVTPSAITTSGTFVITGAGTTLQYIDGTGALQTFPTIPAQYNPTAGTGISITGSYPNQTITNTLPDQTVSLSNGTGISVTGTYPNFTITNTGLINVPDLQSVLIAGSTLSQNNTINGGGFTLLFNNNYKFNIISEQHTGLQATDGTINSYLDLYPQSNTTKWGYDNGAGDTTEIEMTGVKMYVRTPSYATATAGDVLTLQSGGYIEYQTPTGGGGIPFGTASGTDTYTTTITGVTAYADGDAYIIRFTTGNTDASTLNINGIGAKTLYKNNDGPIIGGDIWDGAEMLCVYNLTLDAFDCIGTSPNTLYAYVTNVNGSTITKGQAVYAFGGTGNRMTVKLARANSDATSAQTIGFVYSTSIADNQKGIIIIQGYFIGLGLFHPSNGWVDGDPVYLSPTTAGAVTRTKPYAPDHLVYLGFVATASNGNAGRMYVRVQNGYELDELHNVQAQSPALKDTLWYDNTVTPGQWKTASIGTILGYTPVPSTRTISTTSPLTGGGDLSADRTISIPAATSSVNGYLTSSDWTNFNTAYTNRITSLTTTGTSGAATLSSNTLNIPQYQGALTLTTTGSSGAATLVGNTLNIPQYSGGSGTVTSVAALTLGTTGTDLSSTVANSTTTPVITLNVPNASATNRGVLSTTDWSNFNTAYTNRITSITNTGTSGNATISSNTLNVPNYALNDLGRISVSTANAREDNYAPTGWPGTTDRVKVIVIDSTNTNYMMSLGGLASPSAGRIVTIVNASTANNLIIIENLSTSSTAANRFQMTSNMAYFLLPTRSITFIYDGTYWTQMSASLPMGLDFFDDCTSGPQNSGAGLTTAYGLFGTSATGAGSSLRAEGDAFGSYGIVTGTSATGAFYMSTQARRNGGVNSFAANSTWPMLAVGKIALIQLGTALQDFTAAFGINGQQTTMNSTVPTGYVWHYPGSANSVWENKSTSATGVTSTVSSPLTASGSFVILGVYKPGGANIRDAVYFYSTDAIIYTFSSKFVGTTGTYGGWVSFGIASTVGTTSKEMRIDYAGSSFNVAR